MKRILGVAVALCMLGAIASAQDAPTASKSSQQPVKKEVRAKKASEKKEAKAVVKNGKTHHHYVKKHVDKKATAERKVEKSSEE